MIQIIVLSAFYLLYSAILFLVCAYLAGSFRKND